MVFVLCLHCFLGKDVFFFPKHVKKRKSQQKVSTKKGAAKLRGGMEISDSKVKVVLLGVSGEDHFFRNLFRFQDLPSLKLTVRP